MSTAHPFLSPIRVELLGSGRDSLCRPPALPVKALCPLLPRSEPVGLLPLSMQKILHDARPVIQPVRPVIA